MDRFSVAFLFFVLGTSAMADPSAVKVLFEKYDSIRSMLPFLPVRHHNKRQTDGAAQENPVVTNDHHVYYTSMFFPPGDSADGLWFELSNRTSVEDFQENTTEVLGYAHREYHIWDLKFTFPFYGHILNAVGVTSLGFLYTGTIYHEQVYLSQYIAPLMADFNPSLTTSGRILVYSTEERFTVQWDQVLNHDHENDGPFTFQVSIFPTGTIYFAYRKLPLLWNELNNDDLPVEVGIADAFYVHLGGQLIVVEYSRVNATDLLADEYSDLSYSAFEIDPVPNCVTANTCSSCMAITRQGIFNCSWCEATEQKCSDGQDRFTIDWLKNLCPAGAVFTCPHATISPSKSWISSSNSPPPISPSKSWISSFNSPLLGTLDFSPLVSSSRHGISVSTTLYYVTSSTVSPASGSTIFPIGSVVGLVICLVVLLVVVIAICLVGFLAIYGARHPTSRIGLLIFKNPRQVWRFPSTMRAFRYEMQSTTENVYN